VHLALHLEVEHRARRVGEAHRLAEKRAVAAAVRQRERLGVDGRRRLPVRQLLRRARREEQRELSPLGPQPKPILTAVRIDVRGQLARRDQLTVQPTEAAPRGAGRRAGGDPPLKCRAERHLRRAISVRQYDGLGVASQKIEIVAEAARRAHSRSSITPLAGPGQNRHVQKFEGRPIIRPR
jgi:hypothetical protein